MLDDYSKWNIPRRYWSEEECPVPELEPIVANLETHFFAGDSFLLMGGDFSLRLRAASWFAKKAVVTGNRYFRSKWDEFKPLKPKPKQVPFTLWWDEIDNLVGMKMRNTSEEDIIADLAFRPDVLILSELGTEYPNQMLATTLDDILRKRFEDGLMTVLTVSSTSVPDDERYLSATRDILKGYTEIRVKKLQQTTGRYSAPSVIPPEAPAEELDEPTTSELEGRKKRPGKGSSLGRRKFGN